MRSSHSSSPLVYSSYRLPGADINIPIFAALYFGYKIVYKTRIWKPLEMDFVTVSFVQTGDTPCLNRSAGHPDCGRDGTTRGPSCDSPREDRGCVVLTLQPSLLDSSLRFMYVEDLEPNSDCIDKYVVHIIYLILCTLYSHHESSTSFPAGHSCMFHHRLSFPGFRMNCFV